MMYNQAETEFEEVAKIDPNVAMAYWGIAMTLLHPLWPGEMTKEDLEKGWEAVQQAKALNPATMREKSYIYALEAFYKDWETVEHKTRLTLWEAAQKKVFETYPDDPEAMAFYALAHLATAPRSDKTFTHQREAGKILETLHAKMPGHPAGFHYLIHAYDNPTLANLAEDAAHGYDKIAPDVPHALHMPSHIFTRLGHWSESIGWNERSADAAWRQPVNGATSMHYTHAVDYLMYAYLQKAQDKKAKDLLEMIYATENYQHGFATAYGLAAAQARYSLERGKWNEAAVLSVHVSDSVPLQKYPGIESIVYFTRGLGAARINDLSAAQREIDKLDIIYNQLIEKKQNYWAVLTNAQRKTIAAWVAFSRGDTGKALMIMQEAADLEESVDKHPVTPGAVLPARELLGDMLVLLNKPEEALKAYEISLKFSPNRFNSLYGAGHAAELGGDLRKAEWYYTRLLEMSDQDNTDRNSIKVAKKYLSTN
jgi:tetratricopeptide (TPR) repeat protein